MTAARTIRRLPGFRFEAQPPPLEEVLPRMDVAAFVGFAASGPLHLPVAVEDAAQFASVFGGDAPLAWDARRGQTVYAHLAPAVKAFFRNGGRRCWVIRVAGRARANYFNVPGLAVLGRDGRLDPALARARSEGSWSDDLQTTAALTSRPVVVTRYASPANFELELRSPDEVVEGDLLRLTFGDGLTCLLVVESVKPSGGASVASASAVARFKVSVAGGRTRWFRPPGAAPVVKAGSARVLTVAGRNRRAAALVEPKSAWGRGKSQGPGEQVTLNLDLRAEDTPALGSFVRATLGNRALWLRVDEARVLARSDAPVQTVQVAGESTWLLKTRPAGQPAKPPACEKLLFELRVRRGDDDPVSLSGLAFAPRHARFWGALPSDAALYADDTSAPDDNPHSSVLRDASAPRFPLAGNRDDDAQVYLPVLMPAFPEHYLGPRERRGEPLTRDGLDLFDTDLFLDAGLKETGVIALASQADFIRYQSPRPRRLKGVHAAFGLEEATIICVPDAVHGGWTRRSEAEHRPRRSTPLPHPEWWRFLDCGEARETALADEPRRENFLDCGLRVIAPPTLKATPPDAAGTLTLSWAGEADAQFVLEESNAPDWTGAAVVYEGGDTQVTIYGRGAGHYFYRVRATAGGSSSNWSQGVGVLVRAGAGWESNLPAAFQSQTLLEVHCALLRMCAARGDMLAVLSLPEHFREADALGHVAQLKPSARLSASADGASAIGGGTSASGGHGIGVSGQGASGVSGQAASLIAPLSFGETRALSFGALYHPWLYFSGEGAPPSTLRRCPPDGVAAGVIARRAFERGAWIAPANELLQGVVALDPPVRRARLLDLQDAQVNALRQEPRGFVALSADTLSDEVDWRPIGVRRLLSLLRRVALKLGATYVFEPNNEAFRRLVRRGFEGLLGGMYARGAFAGANAEAAFRVVTDSTLNTRQLADEGRFIVEIKVAPSLPLTFLTIRLVQSGDRGLATVEG